MDECFDESVRDRLQCLVKDEGPEVLDFDADKCLSRKGLSPEASVATAPKDWKPVAAKREKGEPAFLDVDNPGKKEARASRRPCRSQTGAGE